MERRLIVPEEVDIVMVQETSPRETSPAQRPTSALVLVACPECGAPAEVEWRDVVESTDGPVEHWKIRCLHRHCFLMPVDRLSPGSADPDTAEAAN